MIITVIVVVWVVCGVYSWGTTLAYFDTKFPSENSYDNAGIAAFVAVMGPVGAVTSYVYSSFNQYGWHLWKRRGEE